MIVFIWIDILFILTLKFNEYFIYFWQIVDLLVRLLSSKPPDFESNELMQRMYVEAYDCLETYLLGNSRKNELYFAKYIDYFSTQYEVRVGIFLVTVMQNNYIKFQTVVKKKNHNICNMNKFLTNKFARERLAWEPQQW